MRDLVCCLDIGTSNIKAALVDDRGGVQALASAPTPGDPIQTPDQAIDLESSLATVGRLTTELLAADGVTPAAVQALVLTGQRATVVTLDGAERPLSVLSWQDVRPTAEVARLAAEIPAGRFAALTGLPGTAMLSLLKILWLRTRRPELYAASERHVLVHDYLLRRLGADDYLTDRSNASATGLFELAAEGWSDEILGVAGLTPAQLPTLAPAGTRAGALAPAVAGALGLPAGLPLVVGGGDQQCAALGMGLSAPGTAGLSPGTAASVMCPVDRPIAEAALGVFCLAHVVPGQWVVEGFFNSVGSTHEWLGRVLAGAPEAEGGEDEVAPSAPMFLPFLAGAGTPDFDETVRGALIGLDLSQDTDALVRAGAEGLALEVRRVLETLRQRRPCPAVRGRRWRRRPARRPARRAIGPTAAGWRPCSGPAPRPAARPVSATATCPPRASCGASARRRWSSPRSASTAIASTTPSSSWTAARSGSSSWSTSSGPSPASGSGPCTTPTWSRTRPAGSRPSR